MTRSGKRTDVRTWFLLFLALVPTAAVLAGAAFLWAERGREIREFEAALVPVEATYELFSIITPLLSAESSLQYATREDSSPDVLARAEADHAAALEALEVGAVTLHPIIDRLDPDRGEMVDSQIVSMLGGSLTLARDILELQQIGEPVDDQLTFLVDLARQSVAGMVLPFVSSVDAEARYLYDALGETVEYHDRFDRDRAAIIDAFVSGEAPHPALISSAVRTAAWKDVADSRLFVPVTNGVEWVSTEASTELPLLLDTNDPLEALLVQLDESRSRQSRDEFFLAVQDLDNRLVADIGLAYAALTQETADHLSSLRSERLLTGLTSLLMAVLGVALAWLTISEVRRRRTVEAAHSAAVGQLSEKAHRDPTTGSWNRRHLESSIDGRLVAATDCGEILVLAYLDLDHFKAINDVWGHSTGDEVLRTVTDRLEGFTHQGIDFELCRVGGDEFVLSATTLKKPNEWFEKLGDAIIGSVESEMDVGGRLHEVGVSVGIATSTADSTLDSLMLEADSSLLLAKRKRGTAVFYDRDTSRTGELVQALPSALANGEICVHVQPVVDSRTGAVHHVEALARWNRPDGDDVSPDVFIPLVESYGLADRLTDTVLDCVGRLIEAPSTPSDACVWVNVSPRELDVANFADRFISTLRRLGVPTSRIGLEITETAAVCDPDRLAIEMRRLRDVGIAVAIDDFGSGYSPLGHLRSLPIDVVKIDRSLISYIDADVANQHIVLGIVGLVHELGMEIVAEGVERYEEQAWLVEHGVYRVQGFLFDRPVHPSAFEWTDRPVADRRVSA